MLSRRTVTLLTLSALPLVVYLGLSVYALLQVDLFVWTWLIPVCWVITWAVAKLWKAPQEAEGPLSLDIPDHWTAQDQAAVVIVQSHQVPKPVPTAQQLTDPHFYLSQAEALAEDLAHHYHPNTDDAISALTVCEVLAATRLAVDDLEDWILNKIPGSHMVTIGTAKKFRHAPQWAKLASDAVWAGSLLMNQANALKFIAQKLTSPTVSNDLKGDFVQAAYAHFVELVGFYLIEMNSGRLRGGAQNYMQHFHSRFQHRMQGAQAEQLTLETLNVAIVGQVKSGKSSLVNLLKGEQVAESNVLPETNAVTSYTWSIPDSDAHLTLLDTPGYADSGINKAQRRDIEKTLENADVILFVLAANSPARQADQEVMQHLVETQQKQTHRNQAPIIGCVSHIDLLSPALEWKPPYDWREGSSPKEESIRDAIGYATELFGDQCATIVPLCTDVERGRASAVEEELLPALLEVLESAKSAALLKVLHQRIKDERWHKLKSQLVEGGKTAAFTYLDRYLKSKMR